MRRLGASADPLDLLIVDDHVLFAEAVARSLGDAGAAVVRIVDRGDSALAEVDRDPPDVALVDIGLPDRSGLDVGHEIIGRRRGVRVIALTALCDTRAVQRAMRFGFHGYVTKNAAVGVLTSAIRSALDGQLVIPHRLGTYAVGERSPEEEAASLLAGQLTKREREILAMLARGWGSPSIASALSIRPNTVRTHVQNLLAKLQVHSRLEAASFAVRHGLVDVSADDAGPDI